jgi:hypothetical protein
MGWRARSERWRALVVELGPALLVALPGLIAVWTATARASWNTLGRDQGIFQYLAWAIMDGDVAYRDARDVNGPVVTMVHALFQGLGGADEHRFRVLDLGMCGLTFALAGACLPSMACGSAGLERRVPLARRMAWALAAWVALEAQYVVYGFWDTAQRESFLDWFVLVSVAVQATVPSWSPSANKSAARLLFLSGAASFVPWLGKPTFAFFTAAQLGAIFLEREPWRARVRKAAIFAIGGLVGVAGPLAFLLLRGDLAAWARITFVDVPAMYRFIWPLPARDILQFPGYSTTALLAVATSVGLLLLIVSGRLPRRALPIALMPVLGLVSVVVQAKGFPYHFHPVTLGFSFGWLVALATQYETLSPAPARPWLRVAVLGGAVLVGGHALLLALGTSDPPAPLASARDKASLESPERLAAFDRIDFFPRALRDAAEYLAATTEPDDRIQTYGMDAYLLFLARRKSATPYVYAYDLNVDAALVGSSDPEGVHPSSAEAAKIRAMQSDHARDLLARVESAPPAAFVFIDRSPLMSLPDAVEDFSLHCPEAARWVTEHYRAAAEFDGIRVWLPKTPHAAAEARKLTR